MTEDYAGKIWRRYARGERKMARLERICQEEIQPLLDRIQYLEEQLDLDKPPVTAPKDPGPDATPEQKRAYTLCRDLHQTIIMGTNTKSIDFYGLKDLLDKRKKPLR